MRDFLKCLCSRFARTGDAGEMGRPERLNASSPSRMRFLWLGWFVAAVLLFGADVTKSAELFSGPASVDSGLTVQEADPNSETVGQRFFILDRKVLDDAFTPAKDGDALSVIRLAPVPELILDFRRTRSERESGRVKWHGELLGGSLTGTAMLVFRRGGVVGHIQVGGRTFRISPVDGDVHRVTEIDSSRLPPEAPPLVRRSMRTHIPLTTKAGNVEIDVLVAYTKLAREGSARARISIGEEAQYAVDLANDALASSGVRHRLRLVGLVYLGDQYDETSVSFDDMLEIDLKVSARLSWLRLLRNYIGADLISVLRESGKDCGIGWEVINPGSDTTALGTSIVRRRCISGHSFAHEVAHNIGARHDRYVANPPLTGFNYGYVNLPARKRSIMAYNNRCGNTAPCERVPMFSTPAIKYGGSIVIGSQREDNARALNANSSAVSEYRTLRAAPDQVTVASTAIGMRGTPSVAALTEGGYVVAWETSSRVFAQIFNPVSGPLGNRIVVSRASGAKRVRVVTHKDGGFLVAWYEYVQTFDTYSHYVQVYNRAGRAVGAKQEFRTSSLSPDLNVTALAGGDYLAVWSVPSTGVFAQRIAASGWPGLSFRIPGAFANSSWLRVAALMNGGYVVGWGVHGQRFDSQNRPVGPQFTVQSTGGVDVSDLVITGLADGGFAVLWAEDWSRIVGVRYRPDGILRAGKLRIENWSEDGILSLSGVAGLNDGGLVALWARLGPDHRRTVFGRRLDNEGAPSGAAFALGPEYVDTSGVFRSPQIDALNGGGYVVTWTGSHAQGLPVFVRQVRMIDLQPDGAESVSAMNNLQSTQ